MSISRDGKKLLVVNGTPEFNVTVWSLETFEKLGEIDIQQDYEFLGIDFSPKDSSLISMLYKETL